MTISGRAPVSKKGGGMTVIRRHAPTWLCEVEVTSWSLSVEGQLSCRRTFLGVCTQPPCLESGARMPSC